MPHSKLHTTLNRRYLIIAGLFLVAAYVLLPQLDQFHTSLGALSQADGRLIAVAALATALTYCWAAATYCLLAFKHLVYWRTVLMQLAAMFANRLLPAGVGGLGANYLYLRRQRHSASEATTLVAINNLLGFVGHMLLLLIVSIALPGLKLSAVHFAGDSWLVPAVGAGIGLILLIILFGRHRWIRFLKATGQQISRFKARKRRLSLALLTSMALTVSNLLAFAACLAAVGINLNIFVLLVVFTLGVGLATAVPTPGGLGGFEAGLVAGLIAYKVDSSAALAAALLYRLVAYWLSMIVGAVAFIFVENRRYI